MIKGLIIILIIAVLLTGCATGISSKKNDGVKNEDNSYKKITSQEANEMMNNEEVIVLDVRTIDEYKEGHIKNAINLPNENILKEAEETLPYKDATILVYCRSGRRSAQASQRLAKLGYTNIYDFGGIIDWPYEIEK